MSEFRELIKDIADDCEIVLAHAEDGALHIVHAAPGAIEKFFEATMDYFGFRNETEESEVKDEPENKTETPLVESESGSAGVQSDVVTPADDNQNNGVADSGGVSGT